MTVLQTDTCMEHARTAGLKYVSDASPGIRRVRCGTGFLYRLPDDGAVRDRATLHRIRGLAIPPAWSDVWICPAENGHIQAVGRDGKGRKQYLYHAQWRELRDADKFDRLVALARRLPRLRARIARDMAKPGRSREKVLATVVSLLDKTLIRVGNQDYARQNDSYGLTTLRNRHVQVDGAALRFHFKGKSGKTWRLSIKDRRIVRAVRQIQELPGQHLFQYVDDAGGIRTIDSADVNAYLRERSGQDVSTKDFRTWAGTVLAAMALSTLGPAQNATQAKTRVREAIAAVRRGSAIRRPSAGGAMCIRTCWRHTCEAIQSGLTELPASRHGIGCRARRRPCCAFWRKMRPEESAGIVGPKVLWGTGRNCMPRASFCLGARADHGSRHGAHGEKTERAAASPSAAGRPAKGWRTASGAARAGAQ